MGEYVQLARLRESGIPCWMRMTTESQVSTENGSIKIETKVDVTGLFASLQLDKTKGCLGKMLGLDKTKGEVRKELLSYKMYDFVAVCLVLLEFAEGSVNFTRFKAAKKAGIGSGRYLEGPWRNFWKKLEEADVLEIVGNTPKGPVYRMTYIGKTYLTTLFG